MTIPHLPWWTCDGADRPPATGPVPTRRAVLTGALGAALVAAAGRSALADLSLRAPSSDGGDNAGDGAVFVVLFLRGGMDGLSLVAPYGDDGYYRARPALALARPGKSNAGALGDLDGFYGLHPAAAALLPFYREGSLAFVQAVGSQDQTRSHFEAMAAVERGLPGGEPNAPGGAEASGWLARHLGAAAPPAGGASPSPLRAVAFTGTYPDTLRGATGAPQLATLEQYRLDAPAQNGGKADAATYARSLAALYGAGNDALARAGQATLNVLDTLHRIEPASYKPEHGAAYPQSELGAGLRQVACLLKAGVGLQTAFLDRGGWDTHVGQGGATGYLAEQLRDVADSLAAFARDLGPAHLPRVRLVALTEFGRRVRENSGLGTDHGRASCALVLGGGVRGGKVYGRWPGLDPAKLEGPGDLLVTTDYRALLGEVVPGGVGRGVFPGYAGPGAAGALGLWAPPQV